MITKEKFLEYTKILDEYNKDITEKEKALEVLFPSSHVFIEDGKVVDLVLNLLAELTDSLWPPEAEGYCSDIEWFYYEREQQESALSCRVNGKDFTVSTWEDLYDLIVKTKELIF